MQKWWAKQKKMLITFFLYQSRAMTPNEGHDTDVNLHLRPVFRHYLQGFPSSRFVISDCRGSLAISSKLVLEVGKNNRNDYMCPSIYPGGCFKFNSAYYGIRKHSVLSPIFKVKNLIPDC